MNLKTELTEPECAFYREMCNFSEEERSIFDLRVKDKSIVQISMALNISTATVNRRLKNIKKKITKLDDTKVIQK